MPSNDDDPKSCGFLHHNPPLTIAFTPGLWAWRCHACRLLRLIPTPNTARIE